MLNFFMEVRKMKNARVLMYLFAITALNTGLMAAVLQDDFDGAELDTSKWSWVPQSGLVNGHAYEYDYSIDSGNLSIWQMNWVDRVPLDHPAGVISTASFDLPEVSFGQKLAITTRMRKEGTNNNGGDAILGLVQSTEGISLGDLLFPIQRYNNRSDIRRVTSLEPRDAYWAYNWFQVYGPNNEYISEEPIWVTVKIEIDDTNVTLLEMMCFYIMVRTVFYLALIST